MPSTSAFELSRGGLMAQGRRGSCWLCRLWRCLLAVMAPRHACVRVYESACASIWPYALGTSRCCAAPPPAASSGPSAPSTAPRCPPCNQNGKARTAPPLQPRAMWHTGTFARHGHRKREQMQFTEENKTEPGDRSGKGASARDGWLQHTPPRPSSLLARQYGACALHRATVQKPTYRSAKRHETTLCEMRRTARPPAPRACVPARSNRPADRPPIWQGPSAEKRPEP